MCKSRKRGGKVWKLKVNLYEVSLLLSPLCLVFRLWLNSMNTMVGCHSSVKFLTFARLGTRLAGVLRALASVVSCVSRGFTARTPGPNTRACSQAKTGDKCPWHGSKWLVTGPRYYNTRWCFLLTDWKTTHWPWQQRRWEGHLCGRGGSSPCWWGPRHLSMLLLADGG